MNVEHIRPFRVEVPQDALDDLRPFDADGGQRIAGRGVERIDDAGETADSAMSRPSPG